jgi:hypothetical protein
MTEIEMIPLFDVSRPEPLKAAKTIAQSERDQNPSWTTYSGKRVACDECVVYLHENHGNGPLPRSARKVRTVRAIGQVLRLCVEHAEPRKAADDEAAEKCKVKAAKR